MPGDAIIQVVTGPGEGRRLDLAIGASGTIGRDPACSLVIPDDSISREHVRLENRPDGLLVAGLGKNPALLDGRKLGKTGVVVRFKTALVLGAAKLEIAFEPPPRPPRGLALDRWLGHSATGTVYAGSWQGVAGEVAVKVVTPRDDRQLLARVRREADLQKRLAHPSIVRVHALLEHGGRLFLVRELVAGETLEDVLAREGRLPSERVAALGERLASALAHAHEAGVIHRDVAPTNVFLDAATGAVRLGDFGFAREDGHRSTIDGTFVTKTSEALGTPCYVAPEQLAGGAKDAGPLADVYALGAVLYHAASGVRPFADVPMDDFFRAVYRGATPLETVAPAVPAALACAIMGAMHPLIEERPEAVALAARLRELAAP